MFKVICLVLVIDFSHVTLYKKNYITNLVIAYMVYGIKEKRNNLLHVSILRRAEAELRH